MSRKGRQKKVFDRWGLLAAGYLKNFLSYFAVKNGLTSNNL